MNVNKLGKCLMVLGTLMLVTALALFLYNQLEATQAQKAADTVIPQLVDQIQQNEDKPEPLPIVPVAHPDMEHQLEILSDAMKEAEIDGHTYIGYLSIPVLELELPIMADWDYPSLRIAPCRYTGTIKGDNLVLMAHNYARHFGKISTLTVGDEVLFTDVDGNTTRYQVVADDILEPQAIEEMTAGLYDLTLFTCTYGGKTRVTVYCDRVEA